MWERGLLQEEVGSSEEDGWADVSEDSFTDLDSYWMDRV